MKRNPYWPKEWQKRFHALAIKHALQETDEIEDRELEWLQKARRYAAAVWP